MAVVNMDVCVCCCVDQALLFLDEPTSGLDARAALMVVQVGSIDTYILYT